MLHFSVSNVLRVKKFLFFSPFLPLSASGTVYFFTVCRPCLCHMAIIMQLWQFYHLQLYHGQFFSLLPEFNWIKINRKGLRYYKTISIQLLNLMYLCCGERCVLACVWIHTRWIRNLTEMQSTQICRTIIINHHVHVNTIFNRFFYNYFHVLK